MGRDDRAGVERRGRRVDGLDLGDGELVGADRAAGLEDEVDGIDPLVGEVLRHVRRARAEVREEEIDAERTEERAGVEVEAVLERRDPGPLKRQDVEVQDPAG